MHDPTVFVIKTEIMQRMLDSVLHGYVFHTCGHVSYEKAPKLLEKFDKQYRVLATAAQRAYAKKHKKASARLFFYADKECADLHWWLVATQGQGAVHEHERLKIAGGDKHQRLTVGDDYELVQLTRSREKGGGRVWTWRMTAALHANWLERIKVACRGRASSQLAQQAIHSLFRAPGFSGIRVQVGHLANVLRNEWRTHARSAGDLEFPSKLGYVERIRSQPVNLSQLVIAPPKTKGP